MNWFLWVNGKPFLHQTTDMEPLSCGRLTLPSLGICRIAGIRTMLSMFLSHAWAIPPRAPQVQRRRGIRVEFHSPGCVPVIRDSGPHFWWGPGSPLSIRIPNFQKQENAPSRAGSCFRSLPLQREIGRLHGVLRVREKFTPKRVACDIGIEMGL